MLGGNHTEMLGEPLVQRDDESAPPKGITAARELISTEKVAAIFGGIDTPVGLATVPVWMSKPQFQYWKHTHLTIDVVPGRGAGFSLEAPTGMRFLIRSRLLTDAELVALVRECKARGVGLRVVGAGHSFTPGKITETLMRDYEALVRAIAAALAITLPGARPTLASR